MTMDAFDLSDGPPPQKRGRPATGRVSGGTYCSAVECHNCFMRDKARGVKFYQFPKDQNRLKEWVLNVKRAMPRGSLWVPSKSAKLCSEHFIGGAKSDEPSSPNYLPCPQSSPMAKSKITKRKHADDARSERCQEREQKRDSLKSHNASVHFEQDGNSSNGPAAKLSILPKSYLF